nr:MAG TPA: hypothetical protein [Bacteriophage sp.]
MGQFSYPFSYYPFFIIVGTFLVSWGHSWYRGDIKL